jgi:hypothetical protein
MPLPPWSFTVKAIEPEEDYLMLPREKEMILCRPDNFCLYRHSYERCPDDGGKWFTFSVDDTKTKLTLEFWGREGEEVWERQQNPWHHVILTIPYQQRWGFGFSYVGEPITYKHTVQIAVGVYAVMMDIPFSELGGKS